MVQKPFKQGLKTSNVELQGQVDSKTNYISGFTLVVKNKKGEKRKLIKVVKGNLLKAYSDIKEEVKKLTKA